MSDQRKEIVEVLELVRRTTARAREIVRSVHGHESLEERNLGAANSALYQVLEDVGAELDGREAEHGEYDAAQAGREAAARQKAGRGRDGLAFR